MENDYHTVMQKADKDAEKLNVKGNLHNAAEAVQRLFDDSMNLSPQRRDFIVNSYVKEVNKHADDIYGKGNHITVEITDSSKNKSMMLDKNDTITSKGTDGEKYPIRASQYGGAINNPY